MKESRVGLIDNGKALVSCKQQKITVNLIRMAP